MSVLVFSVIIYGCDQLLLVCCLIESDKNQGSSGTGKKEFNYQKQNELSTEANQRPDQDDSRSIDPRLGYFNRVELDAVQNEGDFSKHNETFGDFDTEEDQGQETEANVTQSTEAQGEYRIKTYHRKTTQKQIFRILTKNRESRNFIISYNLFVSFLFEGGRLPLSPDKKEQNFGRDSD